MRRKTPTRASVIGAAVACAALLSTGADKTPKKDTLPKVEETIGDVSAIYGRDYKVEGVGLVLDSTARAPNPPPPGSRRSSSTRCRRRGSSIPTGS